MIAAVTGSVGVLKRLRPFFERLKIENGKWIGPASQEGRKAQRHVACCKLQAFV
jgi:hypothetical protein